MTETGSCRSIPRGELGAAFNRVMRRYREALTKLAIIEREEAALADPRLQEAYNCRPAAGDGFFVKVASLSLPLSRAEAAALGDCLLQALTAPAEPPAAADPQLASAFRCERRASVQFQTTIGFVNIELSRAEAIALCQSVLGALAQSAATPH